MILDTGRRVQGGDLWGPCPVPQPNPRACGSTLIPRERKGKFFVQENRTQKQNESLEITIAALC